MWLLALLLIILTYVSFTKGVRCIHERHKLLRRGFNPKNKELVTLRRYGVSYYFLTLIFALSAIGLFLLI